MNIAANTELTLDLSGDDYNYGSRGVAFLQEFAVGLATRTLVKFDISKNSLYAEGSKIVAQALKENRIMTELNISLNSMTYNGSNFGEMSGVVAMSDAISTMGALTKLTVSGDFPGSSQPVTIETSMTRADFSSKYHLGASGAIMLAAFLPKCT